MKHNSGPAHNGSGTITGWGHTWPAMFSGEARDCLWSEGFPGANPECEAWVVSGCDLHLAGRNPAVTASIVDDGHHQRHREARVDPHLGAGSFAIRRPSTSARPVGTARPRLRWSRVELGRRT